MAKPNVRNYKERAFRFQIRSGALLFNAELPDYHEPITLKFTILKNSRPNKQETCYVLPIMQGFGLCNFISH